MDRVKNDKRFAHVVWDPKFRRMPAKERKVKIDSRFKAMFTDPHFQNYYTVDKRGRPFYRTAKENLRDFYDMDSAEETDESVSTDSDHPVVSESDKPATEEKEKRDDSGMVREVDGVKEETEDDEEEIRIDLARGIGNVTTSESEDSEWELESDEEDAQDWTQLDAGAPRIDWSSRRLALCNMDWNRIQAKDLYAVFNSFKPAGGVVKSVTIYPSEFGLQRMADEAVNGPVELRGEDEDDHEETLDVATKGSAGWKRHLAKVREYEVNRLRYYYAIVDCDSENTANAIYTACDGMEYMKSTIKMDLRFVPDELCFDASTAKETATAADCDEQFKPTYFDSTSLSRTDAKLTWDDDDFHRKQKVQRAFKENILEGEGDFDDIIASGSSEEDEEETANGLVECDGQSVAESSAFSVCSSSRQQSRMEMYRQLLKELKQQDEKRKKRRIVEEETEAYGSGDDCDLEVTFEPALQSKADQLMETRKGDQDQATPWKRYLEKRKEKRRMRNLERRTRRQEAMNEEHEGALQQEDKAQARLLDELELLAADDGNARDYNLKALIKEAKDSGGASKGRRSLPAGGDEFRLNLQDKRFDAIYSSHLFNIDPSSASFKKTKGMEAILEEKRRRVRRREMME